jgi:hypothetical protein
LANDEDVYVDFATPIGAKIRRPLALWLSVTKKPEFANHRSLVNVSMLDQIVFDRLVELEHAALEVVADQWDFADVARVRSRPISAAPCRASVHSPTVKSPRPRQISAMEIALFVVIEVMNR